MQGLDAGVVHELAGLVSVAGTWGACAIIATLLGVPGLFAVWVTKLRAKARGELLNEKEKEIQRLAAENSEYKQLFMKHAGMAFEKYEELRRGLPPKKTLGSSRNTGVETQMQGPPAEDKPSPAGGPTKGRKKEGG